RSDLLGGTAMNKTFCSEISARKIARGLGSFPVLCIGNPVDHQCAPFSGSLVSGDVVVIARECTNCEVPPSVGRRFAAPPCDPYVRLKGHEKGETSCCLLMTLMF